MKIKCAYHLCNNEFEEKEGNKQATLHLCRVLFMQRNSENIAVNDAPNMTRWRTSFN